MGTMTAPRTLIADDQPDILEALRLLLKREGYQIDSVSSPKAVLESLRCRDYDVVLMDLNYALDTTSGQEGLDLLERIQRLDSTLPIVVMTAWGSIPLAVEAMRRGARDFVEKPWDNSQLLETLRAQIGAFDVRRQDRQESDDAADVQRSLLPRRIPEVPGYDIALTWQPARAVGGDYVDFLDLPDGRLGIGVADAIGKGVGAALLMANLQAAMRVLAASGPGPETLSGRVNRVLAGNTAPGKYITFFYGILDAARARFEYTNAGHNAPILIHASGECERLERGGAVLGVFPDWEYQRGEAALAPGDRLVLFTDGITEFQNAVGEDFGEERLLDLIRANRRLDAQALRQAVMDALAAHSPDGFQDDVTLVVLAAA
jgi:sigma-B regulation protein RsbU (phosphoserine phosphatase)